MTRPRPNLFVPGTQKGASTTLSLLLASHREVYRGAAKEPNYFSDDEVYAVGMDAYTATQYPRYEGQRYVLDASQSYLALSEIVPERIYRDLGEDIRFIVTLRNPVDRMESAFKHFRELPDRELDRSMQEIVPAMRDGITLDDLLAFEERAVREAIESGRILGRNPTWTRYGFPYRYAYAGCYSIHLHRYFEYFPVANFLFLPFEDLTQNQPAAVASVESFLGLSPGSLTPDRALHSSRIKIYKNEWLGRALRPVKALVKPLVPKALKYRIADAERRYLLADGTYKFDAATYNRLLAVFEEELAATERLTGCDLSRWRTRRLVPGGQEQTVGVL